MEILFKRQFTTVIKVLNLHDYTVLSAKQRQKLHRITISACLYAINTLFLFNLPDMIIFINPGGINRRVSICYILLLNRGVFNIFIYTVIVHNNILFI